MNQILQAYNGGPSGPRIPHHLVAVVLCAALILSCEKKDSSVIDSLGSPPSILGAAISPATIALDTIPQSLTEVQLIADARVSNQEGLSQISEVDFIVVDAVGSETLASGQLADDGVSPDLQANDSVYTAQISLTLANLPVGKYYCRIAARSAEGYLSNTLLIPFVVVRYRNRPPVLSDLQGPDTVSLGGQRQVFPLLVKATDPDGQTDVARVFFHTFKPDGSPANNGNAFFMYDDGSTMSGDAVKGDSIYTLTVQVDTSNAKGRYRFEFQATDRSSDSSQVLVKYIQIVN